MQNNNSSRPKLGCKSILPCIVILVLVPVWLSAVNQGWTVAGTTGPLVSLNDELGKPRREYRIAATLVEQFLRRHLSNRELNDEIARRSMRIYLESLDPMKMYFTKSDVEEFAEEAPQIDDNLGRGDYSIAFLVFRRFLERVEERVELAQQIIESPLDFSKDEFLITDPDQIEYAASLDEVTDRWRKRIKYNMLLYENDKASDKDPQERLLRRYQSYSNRLHNYGNDEVIELYLSAITNSFDPHTSYMSGSTYESFMINMRLELDGIGATLQSTEDGLTVIRRIVPDGAADKQGELQVEDKIVSVGQGEDGEMVEVIDMNLNDVVDMIRGEAGTVVRLGVLAQGRNEIKTISIVRERIELKDSAAHGEVLEAGEKADGSAYRIGVIGLPSFYTDMSGAGRTRSTTRDVEEILKRFKQEGGVDTVVMDLRQNGGGSLPEAINCTGLFIDKGPVVQVKNLYGDIEVLRDKQSGATYTGPLVVLVSKFSASASEIFAGAVQDYGRGIIVGDSATHGKGTVQTLVDLGEQYLRMSNAPKYYGALKLTIQQFYRPNGESTQKRGVLSDIVLPSITDHMDVSEDDLDYALEFDQIPAADYTPLPHLAKQDLQELQTASENRISENEEFRKLLKRIDRYLEQKADKKVALNRETFNEQRKEFDADKADLDALEEQLDGDSAIVRTFYLEECLNIAVDYVQALSNRKIARNN